MNPINSIDIKTIGIEINILYRNLIDSNRLYTLFTKLYTIIMTGKLIQMATKST